MFYASKNYKVVCKEGCFHIKNIKEKNLLKYDTLYQAIDDGCRPCKHCLKYEGAFAQLDKEEMKLLNELISQ